MNKEFVRKMIKAKKMEYEALCELLPEKVREDMEKTKESIQESVKTILQECLKEMLFPDNFGEDGEKAGSGETTKGSVRKVTIE